MKPVKQTKLHFPPWQNGNCFAACIASILEKDISEIPCFEDIHGDGAWWAAVVEWAESQNLIAEALTCKSKDTDKQIRVSLKELKEMFLAGMIRPGYCIITGASGHPDVDHCVVGLDGEVVFDPFPSDKGPIRDVVDLIYLLPKE